MWSCERCDQDSRGPECLTCGWLGESPDGKENREKRRRLSGGSEPPLGASEKTARDPAAQKTRGKKPNPVQSESELIPGDAFGDLKAETSGELGPLLVSDYRHINLAQDCRRALPSLPLEAKWTFPEILSTDDRLEYRWHAVRIRGAVVPMIEIRMPCMVSEDAVREKRPPSVSTSHALVPGTGMHQLQRAVVAVARLRCHSEH